MRLACPLLVLVGLLLPAALSAAEPATTLTLDQALASAEGVNINVLLGREAAVQALEVANQTRAGILPNISASASQRRSKGVGVSNGVATAGAASSRFDANLNGSYPLFDPSRWVALRADRVGIEIAKADYDAVVQSVLAGVAQSYFAHLRNLRRLDVLDNNISRARTLLELARNQLAVGVATQIDVTRADAQLALADQARLQQLTTVYESELLLKRALDLNPSGTLRLVDVTLRRVDEGLVTFGDDKSLYAKRPDYLRAEKAVEQARLDVRAATFQRLPLLSLSGSYGVAGESLNADKDTGWSAGAAISVPIFDGMGIDADRRLALSRQRSQEMRLRNLELQISSELRLAAQDAQSRNAQMVVAEKSLQLAEEELRLAEQRYRQGVADNREVVEAQNRRAIAADNFVEAGYQYNLSRVELARARGDVKAVLKEKAP